MRPSIKRVVDRAQAGGLYVDLDGPPIPSPATATALRRETDRRRALLTWSHGYIVTWGLTSLGRGGCGEGHALGPELDGVEGASPGSICRHVPVVSVLGLAPGKLCATTVPSWHVHRRDREHGKTLIHGPWALANARHDRQPSPHPRWQEVPGIVAVRTRRWDRAGRHPSGALRSWAQVLCRIPSSWRARRCEATQLSLGLLDAVGAWAIDLGPLLLSELQASLDKVARWPWREGRLSSSWSTLPRSRSWRALRVMARAQPRRGLPPRGAAAHRGRDAELSRRDGDRPS